MATSPRASRQESIVLTLRSLFHPDDFHGTCAVACTDLDGSGPSASRMSSTSLRNSSLASSQSRVPSHGGQISISARCSRRSAIGRMPSPSSYTSRCSSSSTRSTGSYAEPIRDHATRSKLGAMAAVGSTGSAVRCSIIDSRSIGRSASSIVARRTTCRASCRVRWCASMGGTLVQPTDRNPVEPTPRRRLHWAPMNITSGKAIIAADALGSGSPDVLLVHAGVTDRRSWQHVVDALPDQRCIDYDSPGSGETPYEPEDGWSRVDDAVAVLDAYGVDSAVVVACSLGGRTSLDLALSHPDRVRALVLIGSAVSGAPPIELEEDLAWLEDAFEKAEESGDLDELNRLEALVWLDGPRAGEGRVTGEARDLFLEMNRKALGAPDPGEERQVANAWERAGQIPVPTLVLIGEYDLPHTHANADRLAASIPGARLVSLPGTAHLPHLENDPLTIREIAGFVGGLAP